MDNPSNLFFTQHSWFSLFCSMPKDEAQLYAANELYVLLANTSIYIFCFPFYTWVLEVLFHLQFKMFEDGFYLDLCNMFSSWQLQ